VVPRLEEAEDGVDGERRRRPKDEVETGVDENKVIVFKALGRLIAKTMAEDLEKTRCHMRRCC
jgi:hypothetical protein